MNRVLVTLIRREFWENRALWIAPLLAVAAVLGAMAFGNINARSNPSIAIHPAMVMRGIVMACTTFLAVVSVLAGGLYLSDCLYGERKDRSILFWKSLPVSDTTTVISKLLVPMVVLPLGVLLLSVVVELIGTGIFLVRMHPAPGTVGAMLATWPTEVARVTVAALFCMLWYMPIATYLMIASVVARRVPLGYAVLPPVGAAVLEPLMFGSNHVSGFLRDRMVPWGRLGGQILDLNADTLRAFADLELWLGLAAAAGMLYIVIRLRRYRDDT
jgi:ABC-2 type transport system permease protein